MRLITSRNVVVKIGLSILVLSALLVVGLVVASGILRDTRGSFLRNLPPHPVEELDSINVGSYSYYFAGSGEGAIYLAKHSNPFDLLRVSVLKLDTQYIRLNYVDVNRNKHLSPTIAVEGDCFYLLDGAVPEIFEGDLNSRLASNLENDSIYFLDLIPIASGEFFVKALSAETKQSIVGRISVGAPHWRGSDRILEKQKDGVFCTDGTISFDRVSGKIAYAYYYRNQFMVIDQHLNLMYRANTIDTITVAQIVPAKISKDQSLTLASPHYIVNRRIRMYGAWIFVHSEKAARNEHRDALKSASVIDVYQSSDGGYAFSFYIYNFNGSKKMNDFLIEGDRLIVRYGNVLQAFRLKPEFFKKDNVSARLR